MVWMRRIAAATRQATWLWLSPRDTERWYPSQRGLGGLGWEGLREDGVTFAPGHLACSGLYRWVWKGMNSVACVSGTSWTLCAVTHGNISVNDGGYSHHELS